MTNLDFEDDIFKNKKVVIVKNLPLGNNQIAKMIERFDVDLEFLQNENLSFYSLLFSARVKRKALIIGNTIRDYLTTNLSLSNLELEDKIFFYGAGGAIICKEMYATYSVEYHICNPQDLRRLQQSTFFKYYENDHSFLSSFISEYSSPFHQKHQNHLFNFPFSPQKKAKIQKKNIVKLNKAKKNNKKEDRNENREELLGNSEEPFSINSETSTTDHNAEECKKESLIINFEECNEILRGEKDENEDDLYSSHRSTPYGSYFSIQDKCPRCEGNNPFNHFYFTYFNKEALPNVIQISINSFLAQTQSN